MYFFLNKVKSNNLEITSTMKYVELFQNTLGERHNVVVCYLNIEIPFAVCIYSWFLCDLVVNRISCVCDLAPPSLISWEKKIMLFRTKNTILSQVLFISSQFVDHLSIRKSDLLQHHEGLWNSNQCQGFLFAAPFCLIFAFNSIYRSGFFF